MKIFSFFLILFCIELNAQLIGLGLKMDEKPMFDIAANYPLIFKDSKNYSLSLGAEFSTSNSQMPSGLQFQLTPLYHFLDDAKKDYFLSLGFTAGYLLDFNSEFSNQFRISPHFYAEYILFYCKLGYDYVMPLDQGSFFVSIGIGGGYLMRHFKIGL